MFERPKKRFPRTFGIIILMLFLIISVGFFAIPKYMKRYQKPLNDQNINYNDQSIKPQQLSVATDTPDTAITKASSNVLPSVVGISTTTLPKDKLFDSGGAGQWGVGSGVIISSNGYILTNNHVVGGKSRIVVTLENGKVVEGKTVWSDDTLDIAIVKVNGSGLPVATLGDNSTLKVGDVAIAIGNPLGLQFQRTVTSGVISGLNRTISIDTGNGSNFMEDLIQTDAIINPGNSGGPLINSKGEVIGINTVKIQTAEGMGFAIPINVIKPIVRNFVEKGDYVAPYIGIFAYDRNVMNYLDNGIKLDKGIYVATVDAAGPAGKAGMKVGDVITNIDNIEVNTMMDLRTYIYNKGVGSTVNLSYYSGGQPKTASIVLITKPSGNMLTR